MRFSTEEGWIRTMITYAWKCEKIGAFPKLLVPRAPKILDMYDLQKQPPHEKVYLKIITTSPGFSHNVGAPTVI